MYSCVCLLVYLSVYRSIYLLVYLFPVFIVFFLRFVYICWWIREKIITGAVVGNLDIYLSIHPYILIYLSIHIYWYIYLIHLRLYLYIYILLYLTIVLIFTYISICTCIEEMSRIWSYLWKMAVIVKKNPFWFLKLHIFCFILMLSCLIGAMALF